MIAATLSSGRARSRERELPLDQEIEVAGSLTHEGVVGGGPPVLDEIVGVAPVRDLRDAHVEPALQEQIERPGRGVTPRGIAVVADDDALGVASEQLDLRRGERRAQRRNRIFESGLMNRDQVQVPLDEYGEPFTADRVTGNVETVEVLTLHIRRGLGRVEVFRLGISQSCGRRTQEPVPRPPGSGRSRGCETGRSGPIRLSSGSRARPTEFLVV